MTVEEFKELVEKTNRKSVPSKGVRSGGGNSHPEHDLQVACVEWFRTNYPAHYLSFWATPNGGYRSKKTAVDMKEEGQKRGVPDLQLAFPSKGFHGLFIEMKKSSVGKKGQLVGKGRVSEDQERIMRHLTALGYRCEVCYSFDQFKAIIEDYL